MEHQAIECCVILLLAFGRWVWAGAFPALIDVSLAQILVGGAVAVLVALISQLPNILIAQATLRSSRDSLKQSVDNAARISQVHSDVNGKMQELIDSTGREKLATGHAEGMAEERSLGITERQDRVAEAERVEDRADQRATDAKK